MVSPPPSQESGGTPLLYLAASTVAAAALSIAAYRYGAGGAGRRSRGRRRGEVDGAVPTLRAQGTLARGHSDGRSAGESDLGQKAEDCDHRRVGESEGGSPENENERLQRAIEAKDRDKVRAILRARNDRQSIHGNNDDDDDDGASPADAGDAKEGRTSSTMAFDASLFSCPVCLQLLYKPCVNTCGHAFCFWCLHSAMSAVHSSSCPLCRNPFTQFASILGPLQRFLVREFPDEMKRRETEVRSEEDRKWGGTQAPRVDEAGHAEGSKKGMIGSVDALDLLCVKCNHVVSQPVVPACGHLVCRGCILSDGGGSSGMNSDGPSCPQCETPILDGLGGRAGELAVCSILEILLAKVSEADGVEIASIVEEAAKSRPQPVDQKCSTLSSDQTPEVVNSQDAPSDEDADYVHMGIGCDGCGVYPITGRAYRCLDCPEEIGFDLCHNCFSRGVHLRVATGRFNQSHEASHRMNERERQENILHILKRARPDLSMQQIMQLVELQFGNADDDDNRME